MPWPLMSCGISDDGSFRDLWMGDQRAFDLGGAEAMARDVDDSSTRPVSQ